MGRSFLSGDVDGAMPRGPFLAVSEWTCRATCPRACREVTARSAGPNDSFDPVAGIYIPRSAGNRGVRRGDTVWIAGVWADAGPVPCVCCRSPSMLRAGGGQPLIEPDGLVSVGIARRRELHGQIDVGRAGDAQVRPARAVELGADLGVVGGGDVLRAQRVCAAGEAAILRCARGVLLSPPRTRSGPVWLRRAWGVCGPAGS